MKSFLILCFLLATVSHSEDYIHEGNRCLEREGCYDGNVCKSGNRCYETKNGPVVDTKKIKEDSYPYYPNPLYPMPYNPYDIYNPYLLRYWQY